MSARPGAGRLVVSWSVEAPDGAPLRTTVSGPDGAAAGQCPPTPTGCTVSGLTPGLDHTVTLTVGGTRGSASAVPYPAVLDGAATRLWFDPSAPGGLGPRPPAAGQPVRRVDDRSRFGADAVGADGFAAPSVTTLSGHRALRFRTGSGLAFPPGSLPTGGEPATVYVVAVNADANPEQECFALALSWGSVGRGGSRLVTKGCGTSLAFADTYDTWADQTPTRRWLSGRTHVVRADFTPAEFSVWMDGAFSYRWPTTPDALRTRSHPTGMLGAAFWDTGSSWRGVIGEVVVLSGTPTAAEDRAITDYLTRKWTS